MATMREMRCTTSRLLLSAASSRNFSQSCRGASKSILLMFEKSLASHLFRSRSYSGPLLSIYFVCDLYYICALV